MNFTYAWPGAVPSPPVDPVVELRVCVQTEVHGLRCQGSAHRGSGVPGRHWDKGRITSVVTLRNQPVRVWRHRGETSTRVGWEIRVCQTHQLLKFSVSFQPGCEALQRRSRHTPDGPVNLEQEAAQQAPEAETTTHIPL